MTLMVFCFLIILKKYYGLGANYLAIEPFFKSPFKIMQFVSYLSIRASVFGHPHQWKCPMNSALFVCLQLKISEMIYQFFSGFLHEVDFTKKKIKNLDGSGGPRNNQKLGFRGFQKYPIHLCVLFKLEYKLTNAPLTFWKSYMSDRNMVLTDLPTQFNSLPLEFWSQNPHGQSDCLIL